MHRLKFKVQHLKPRINWEGLKAQHTELNKRTVSLVTIQWKLFKLKNTKKKE